MTNFQLPMTKKFSKLRFVILLVIGIWSLGFNQVFAVRFYFDVPEREFRTGELIPVRVLIDTEGEDINAINLKIDYPKDFLALENVNNANSIINFWVDSLVGVAIGGYRGGSGLVSQLNLKALRAGLASISFELESEAYLNDGSGTKTSVTLGKEALLKIIEGTAPLPPRLVDNELPEDFMPIIARSPDVFENKYFLVFSTQDKSSGVDHYEVQETRQKTPSPTNWTQSSSPHLLANQELSYYIFVKAVDGAGNERVVGLRPQFEEVSRYPWWWIISLIVLILLVIIFAIIKIRRSKRQVE